MNHSTRTHNLKKMLDDRRKVLSDGQPRVHGMVNTRLELAHTVPETVARIDDARARLDGGTYGSCLECVREISEQRLSALPFTVRCQTCEESRQQEHRRPKSSNSL